MDELAVLRAENSRIRERAELMARKIEALEKRLASLVRPAKIASAEVNFIGSWPQRRSWRPSKKQELASSHNASTSLPSLRPYPSHACLTLGRRDVKRVGFSVRGLEGEALALLVDHIAQLQRNAMNFIPVFVTDSPDFTCFRNYGYVFEYLLSPHRRGETEGTYSWQTRDEERLEAIRRKWGLTELFDLGRGDPFPSL